MVKILIIILILFNPLEAFSQRVKNNVIIPKNITTRIPLIISNKNRFYCPLSVNNPSILSIKGPGRLRVITRVRFVNKNVKSLNYKILYKIDGSERTEVEYSGVERSEIAEYKDGWLGVPGKSEDFVIELGSGEHAVEIWSGTDFPISDARYLFKKSKEKKIKWVSLSPLNPCEPVDLVANEDVIRYYRFSKEKPLKIKIFGPTTLRVLNRLENHYTMKGRINYRIQIKEDGKIKNTYMLNSVRSDVTSYRRERNKIPGKAKEIVINVPGGTHRYEMLPLDQDKNTVLGRILFPKKDVKLGE